MVRAGISAASLVALALTLSGSGCVGVESTASRIDGDTVRYSGRTGARFESSYEYETQTGHEFRFDLEGTERDGLRWMSEHDRNRFEFIGDSYTPPGGEGETGVHSFTFYAKERGAGRIEFTFGNPIAGQMEERVIYLVKVK
ncbi:protease inhibitor I42 family protein [Patescibacteria group bacterium]